MTDVAELSGRVAALGTTVRLRVLVSDDSGPGGPAPGRDGAVLADARLRLEELTRAWGLAGRGSELRRPARDGVVADLSPETLLLASLLLVADDPAAVSPGTRWTSQRHPVLRGVDVAARCVHLRDGVPDLSTVNDLMGLTRALALDLVVADLLDEGSLGVLVTGGGHARAAGLAPDHDGWQLPVRLQAAGAPARLGEGGIALHALTREGRVRHGATTGATCWQARQAHRWNGEPLSAA